MKPKRVAVVGSGCSGLAALWALNKSTNHDVHLFEADRSLGGHTNTVPFKHNGKEVLVDTGFIVYNTATYPNFIKFLEALEIETASSEMTFGVSRDEGAFEWAGTSLSGVFAQKTNFFNPRMWRMLFDIVRFNQYALDLLAEEDECENDPATGNGSADSKPANGGAEKSAQHENIGAYLDRCGYSQVFRDDYLIPMTAAIWSTSAEKCSLNFPAITLIRFMWNHHLLNTFAARPEWRTIPGGSQRYIDAIMRDFPGNKVHLNTQVTGIEDINGKVILQFENHEDLFDHVILACHGDQAYEIIKDGGTEEERSVLAGFRTSENVAILHSDTSLMPRSRAAWSAWNLLTTTPSTTTSPSMNPAHVCLTYNMNILQAIDRATYGDVLVTLNPPAASPTFPTTQSSPPSAAAPQTTSARPKVRPDPATIQGTYIYQHPLYTPAAIDSQHRLPLIQNTRGISYAGAWTRYGFHEDGITSGLEVAVQHLGATVPWAEPGVAVKENGAAGRKHDDKDKVRAGGVIDRTFARGRRPPPLGWTDLGARAALGVVGWGVWGIEVGWGIAMTPVWAVSGTWGWMTGAGRAKAKKS